MKSQSAGHTAWNYAQEIDVLDRIIAQQHRMEEQAAATANIRPAGLRSPDGR